MRKKTLKPSDPFWRVAFTTTIWTVVGTIAMLAVVVAAVCVLEFSPRLWLVVVSSGFWDTFSLGVVSILVSVWTGGVACHLRAEPPGIVKTALAISSVVAALIYLFAGFAMHAAMPDFDDLTGYQKVAVWIMNLPLLALAAAMVIAGGRSYRRGD